MKFKIVRASIWSEEKPCEDAFESTYIPVDERTFKSPEEHDAKFRFDKWTSRGSNHRLTSVGIARDMPTQRCFVIEIKDLEHLVNLTKKYGDIIINGDEVEIYDSYRE
jgi:hypothetical protein